MISSGRRLSYRELSRLSARLGHRLRALGAEVNHPIAIVLEKGWEQAVAVFGVLRSGAPYLPIDAKLPEERLRYLLESSKVRVVVTRSSLLERLSLPAGVEAVCVDRLELEDLPETPLERRQGPDDLAVIIYTSGSTGTPNGAMIAHRGLVNAIDETRRAFAVSAADRTLALTALHHDMSIFDLFGVLSVGGSVVIPEPDALRAPGRWAELIRSEGVTIWNSVPAMMDMLVTHLEAREHEQSGGPLRLAFLGGDWIPISLPDRIRSLFGEIELVSVGGPTETTLWNIWYRIEKVDPGWKSIPYGRPIANTRYYVMDSALSERPVWVPGELCCAGVGVAKGYYRNPARTAEKFVEHPITGERLYRTGDRGRLLPDGNIEFLAASICRSRSPATASSLPR